MSYVKTDTILDKILAHKVEEVAAAKSRLPLDELCEKAEASPKPKDFTGALRRNTVALIAEVKKASPSKGVLIEDFQPLEIGKAYAENGAAAISILTDEKFFMGHLDYLRLLSRELPIPTLRKDFIIDPYQVYEAREAGASAVLLIVAALEDTQMADLHALIESLGMAALVEVHNEEELERALKLNVTLIGVNNRDLKSFHVDMGTTERIAKLCPPHITLVAESGMKSVEDVAAMGRIGASAVLIGEGLVTSGKLAETIREFSSQKRG
jgi:indole-3-glycerol phosphate synthase